MLWIAYMNTVDSVNWLLYCVSSILLKNSICNLVNIH